MITFWRDTALTDKEKRLLTELHRGHQEATERQNISSQILQAAYIGSGDYLKAVCSAICSLGGTHAPIIQAYEFLKGFSPNGSVDYRYLVRNGRKLPGWGNSFVKGKPDPCWRIINDYLGHEFPDMEFKIGYVTSLLHELGKNIYPNAACFTAATAIIIGLPKELSPWLVLRARLGSWTQLIYDSQRQSPTQELRDN